jgi:sugar lactone lactonase YvrE
MKLIDTLVVENELGEGVIWDHSASKIWWTDIQQSVLYRYDPETKELENWDTPERLCCFSPRQNGHGLVAAFASGFAFYDPETNYLEWLHKLEEDNPGTRFNDGRTDRQGRLWSGTMVEDEDIAPYKGSLYCLNSDLTVQKSNINDLHIPNSLCWSPDSQTMYHTDTVTLAIAQYPFNPSTGALGAPKPFVTTKDGHYPDGSIIDAAGYLWNAQWGSSTVVRYSPEGQQDLVLEVPASQPSCVAFGGKNLDLLLVTSAWQGMDSTARKADTQAGNFFIYQTEYKGLKESSFIET